MGFESFAELRFDSIVEAVVDSVPTSEPEPTFKC